MSPCDIGRTIASALRKTTLAGSFSGDSPCGLIKNYSVGNAVASDAAGRHKGDACLRSPKNNLDRFFFGGTVLADCLFFRSGKKSFTARNVKELLL